MRDLEAFLLAAVVDPAVYALRPDYRAMLIAVDGIEPGPSDATSEALLTAAEDSARRWTNQSPVDSCRTSRHGGPPTGSSAPNRNAPATASRRSPAEPAADYPG